MLAINILARCIIDLKLNASYITKNMAPRKCYASLLSGGNAKNMINLQKAIQSPWCLPNTIYNGLDVGMFDEAHQVDFCVTYQNEYYKKLRTAFSPHFLYIVQLYGLAF